MSRDGDDTGGDAVAGTDRRPWDLHPALTEERLSACARLLARGRADAVVMSDPWAGDDAWSIGCRAYSFSCNRLRQAARGRRYPWLGVLDGTHHFVFLIEDVPVRFFRGDAEEPTKRTLRQQENEAQQLALALGDASASEGLMFRLAIETDDGGEVRRVVFLALRGKEGRVECFWPVPITEDGLAPRRASRTLTNSTPAMQLPLPNTDGAQAGARRAGVRRQHQNALGNTLA